MKEGKVNVTIECGPPGGVVANLGFDGTILWVWEQLRFIQEVTTSDFDVDQHEQEIAEGIATGYINNISMANEWAELLKEGALESSDVLFDHACIYAVLADQAKKKGDHDKAWSLLARCCWLTGSAGKAVEQSGESEARLRREWARKGGKERGQRLEHVRQEVIRLLNDPPVGGWKASLPTRKAIAKRLEIYRTEKEKMARDICFPSNMDQTLIRWFKDDKGIADAYDRNCAGNIG